MAMPMSGMNAPQSPQFRPVNQPSQQFGSSFWSRLFRGTPDTFMQSTNLTPQQQQMANQSGQMGLQGLLSGQLPAGMQFDPNGSIRQKAQTELQTQTIPTIANRFAGMGDTRNSSAFQSALGRASAGMQENLAAMESQYNSGMAPLLMQLMQMGLNPQYETQMIPGKQGLIEQFIDGLLGGGQGGQGGSSQMSGQIVSMLPQLLKILAA